MTNRSLHDRCRSRYGARARAVVVGVMRCTALAALSLGVPALATAQTMPQMTAPVARGTLSGRLTDRDGRPLPGVTITCDSCGSVITRDDGRFTLTAIPAGERTVRARRLGLRQQEYRLTIEPNATSTRDLTYNEEAVALGEVLVFAASRRAERLLDAPSSVNLVDPARIRDLAPLGQAPLLLADLPGVHVQQGGLFDFNVNARGFNATTNRRMLVLVDGRDISVPLLGSQEWADLMGLDEGARLEVVRGPGSALYGANAYAGVVAITTPSVRDATGTRLSMSGGAPGFARIDLRQAVVSANRQWGVRLTGGFATGEQIDSARTEQAAFAREYARAGVPDINAPAPGYEFFPLRGQRTSGPLGTSTPALGAPDLTRVGYAALRVDRYFARAGEVTAEAGGSRFENILTTTSVGRSQTDGATRPWARLAWKGARHALFATYSGRQGTGTALATGTASRERSSVLQLEGQVDRSLGRTLVTLGSSIKALGVNSFGTILSPEGDNTVTRFGAIFGQVTHPLSRTVSVLAAARGDAGSNISSQFAPKVGIRWSPRATQTLRATVARGYLIAPPLVRYLSIPAGPPLDLTALEAGLRASPLGPALGGVSRGALFTQSAAVPLLALGDDAVRPERVTSYEVGYRAQRPRAFFSIEAYRSELDGFISQLLPGGSRRYPRWSAPEAVPATVRPILEDAVVAAIGPGLSRLANGATAFVLSGGNAGRAREHGVETTLQWQATSHLAVDLSHAWYGFTLQQATLIPGDTVLANTPSNTANAALTWDTRAGTRLRVSGRGSEAFLWRGGLWKGRVPATVLMDIAASRDIRPGLSASLAATNVWDRQHIEFYGASVIGRRVLLSLTWRHP